MNLDQLNALLAGGIFSVGLVFCRVGAAMLLLPGFGDNYTPRQVRLFMALGFSLLIAPVLRPNMPALPSDAIGMAGLLATETVIGLFLGSVVRILVLALETAGMIIAQQVGLASVLVLNPQLAAQGSLPGSLLSISATVLIFSTGLSDMLLRALVDSYATFPVGPGLPIGDFSEIITRTVSEGFLIAVEIAAPFLVVGLLLYVALGLISRLLPQIQVFFVAVPLQLGLGLAVFAITVPAIMLFWVERLQAGLTGLLGGH